MCDDINTLPSMSSMFEVLLLFVKIAVQFTETEVTKINNTTKCPLEPLSILKLYITCSLAVTNDQ